MKAIEKNMISTRATFQAILKTVSALQPAVSALEMLVRQRIGEVGAPVRPIEDSIVAADAQQPNSLSERLWHGPEAAGPTGERWHATG